MWPVTSQQPGVEQIKVLDHKPMARAFFVAI
jgi:hypothetical protein